MLHNVYCPLFARCFSVKLTLNRGLEGYVAAVLSSVAVMVVLTLLDVWVVYFILFRNGLLTDLPLFWWFPLWVMEFVFPLCIILVFGSRIPLTCYLFFVLGGEDTLYYFFTVGHVPENFYGIYFLGFILSPAREIVLRSLTLGVFLSLVLCYVEYERMRRRSLSQKAS